MPWLIGIKKSHKHIHMSVLTLSLTRIAGDDDASWNINQNSTKWDNLAKYAEKHGGVAKKALGHGGGGSTSKGSGAGRRNV